MAYQLGLMFLGVPLNYLLATWGAILWLAIALGLSSLASLLPSRKATHLKIREDLAYE